MEPYYMVSRLRLRDNRGYVRHDLAFLKLTIKNSVWNGNNFVTLC